MCVTLKEEIINLCLRTLRMSLHWKTCHVNGFENNIVLMSILPKLIHNRIKTMYHPAPQVIFLELSSLVFCTRNFQVKPRQLWRRTRCKEGLWKISKHVTALKENKTMLYWHRDRPTHEIQQNGEARNGPQPPETS